jgi:alpha-L-arabinofuranosidase
VLALVNLDPERRARVATNLTSAVTGRVLTGAAMDAHNTFEQPQAVVPAPFSAKPGPQGIVLELPPRSVVVVVGM